MKNNSNNRRARPGKRRKSAKRAGAKRTVAAAKLKKKKSISGGARKKKQLKKAVAVTPKKAALLSEPALLGATAAENCLDLPEAINLVRNCAHVPADLPLNTQLGQIFPSPNARNSFCQCVADGVPKDRSEIRCGASNTLQDVVDNIAC